MTTVRDTSLHAYRTEIEPTLPDREKAVYDVLKAADENLTNNEVAARLNWTINRVTGRTNNLVKRGWVESDGKRPCRCTGRTCYAWKIVRNTLF